MPRRALRLVGVALALLGWVIGIGTILYLASREGLTVGGDLQAYLRAGEDLLAGEPVYTGRIGQLGTFSYAPPWAVAFAALAWLPDTRRLRRRHGGQPAGPPIRGRLVAVVRAWSSSTR